MFALSRAQKRDFFVGLGWHSGFSIFDFLFAHAHLRVPVVPIVTGQLSIVNSGGRRPLGGIRRAIQGSQFPNSNFPFPIVRGLRPHIVYPRGQLLALRHKLSAVSLSIVNCQLSLVNRRAEIARAIHPLLRCTCFARAKR